jgi:hypothetical protein
MPPEVTDDLTYTLGRIPRASCQGNKTLGYRIVWRNLEDELRVVTRYCKTPKSAWKAAADKLKKDVVKEG